MMKFWLTVFIFIFFGCDRGYADFEAVETTLGKLEDVQKEAQNVEEKLKQIQAELNTIRQGAFGQLEEIKSNIANIKKVDVKFLNAISENVQDINKLEKAVAENILPQYGNTNQTGTYIETRNAVNATRRENLSRMYAYALTLRANMDKNRREQISDDESVTAADSREILQSAVVKEAMENARHVAHIWDMQASIDELKLIEMAQRYSNDIGEKDTQDIEEGVLQ